jgi:hypothetical protein
LTGTRSTPLAGTTAHRKRNYAPYGARLLPALQAALEPLAQELASTLGVAYATIGEKRIAGIRARRRAIVVYVRKKEEVPAGRTIPSSYTVSLGGRSSKLLTDVIELPDVPRAFGLRSGHLLRARDGDHGVCGLTLTLNQRRYMLTNAHVVADIARQWVSGPPEALEPGSLRYLPVGPVRYVSPMPPKLAVNEDLAIVEVSELAIDAMGIVDIKYPIARFGSFEEAPAGRYWYVVNGSVYDCAFPEPLLQGSIVSVLVDGRAMPYTGFWKLQIMSGGSAPGQSGALICRGSGRKIEACGMVFGGVQPHFVYAFSMGAINARVAERIG